MRIALRIVGWLLLATLLAAGGLAWWLFLRPLPQVDGTASLPGLQSQVTVDRDAWGVPHIKAASLADLAEAQGYVTAQDRLWQMDLLRRVGRGQLSEIVGPAALPLDKKFRLLRFSAAAEREAANLDEESRVAMEAYARGVNEFIAQHQNKLPVEFTLLKYKPAPWKPADTMVISAYMYETLTETWQDKLDRAKLTAMAGPERAKDLYSQEAMMDHYVVGDPDAPQGGGQRTGDPDDEDDDDDMAQDSLLKASAQTPEGVFPDLTSALAKNVVTWVGESQREIRHGLGSNNWVVSGEHTATGKPLLANDTHLELSLPGIWYEAHLTAPGWNVKGFTLPGAPLVVIGHNDKIAWGFTNNGADVQDLYIETFNPAQADEYKVNGKWVKAQIVDEVIRVKDAADQHFPIVVTRHGPVMQREGDKGYALKWTATEPGGLSNTYNKLGKAQNWREFRELLKPVWGPAQNAVYADAAGNIGYVMAARVPLRKKGHGEVPVPGDTDEYEWKGYIPFEQLPQTLNPPEGLIVTANARVVGPDYKPYLTDNWEEPYRTQRIWELLLGKNNLRPDDMMKVQADTYSYPDVFVAEQLVGAAKLVEPKDERTKKLVTLAKDWNGIADEDSSVVSFLEATRRAALRAVLRTVAGDQPELYQWRSTTFLQWVLTDRPKEWLPKEYKDYDQLLVGAADEAVKHLEKESGSAKVEDWAWKRFDSLEMLHPLGREGWLKRLFSISGKPQGGTGFSPRAATRFHGPAMRIVSNIGDWDHSLMVLPAGQSGQLGSSHYSDQFRYWYEGKPILSPFSEGAEAAAKKHTLTLQP
ncbi:MAG TPA: penicillin acylase family protein [Dongiaceae bacterium]|nr:penicillin acylase family protein [Dongiaceae bacterium]